MEKSRKHMLAEYILWILYTLRLVYDHLSYASFFFEL